MTSPASGRARTAAVTDRDGLGRPRRSGGGLGGCPEPLVRRYDVALLDLDGVVYVGPEPVPGAAAALERARASGVRLAFVTNNASRTAEAVAAHLTDLGIAAGPEEVVTSGQAAARVLAERLPAGAAVLVVGTDALRREVASRGLRVLRAAADHPAAVVQGYGVDTGWRDLAEAAAAIHAGALWVATNTDATIPSARGPLPGNGALVNAVRMATGVDPVVTGKPEPALHRESVQRTGAVRPLVVGDRLDTDIEGATRSDCDSMVVLTGVTTPGRLLAAVPAHRPMYVAADLEGLLVAHPEPVRGAKGGWRCGGWRVAPRSGGRLTLGGDGTDLDALRALCAAAWEEADGVGPAGHGGRVVEGVGEPPGRLPGTPPVDALGGPAGVVLDRMSLPGG
ncbi:MAG TPA: HAD-IIA family hydrolase [Mycobacteriales bacterium]|nr:HAD-IIA family hydrolase [Mycobacteriales bacterium]